MDFSRRGVSENNRRAKYCRLTPEGSGYLRLETGKWDKLAGAIARILKPTKQEGES
jgi:PadR family transcriptional regulator PadR